MIDWALHWDGGALHYFGNIFSTCHFVFITKRCPICCSESRGFSWSRQATFYDVWLDGAWCAINIVDRCNCSEVFSFAYGRITHLIPCVHLMPSFSQRIQLYSTQHRERPSDTINGHGQWKNVMKGWSSWWKINEFPNHICWMGMGMKRQSVSERLWQSLHLIMVAEIDEFSILFLVPRLRHLIK